MPGMRFKSSDLQHIHRTKGRRRVGLLSPYNGTNLGDQAIITTCIERLREDPSVGAVTVICLNPGRVATLHDVATFPITGLAVPFYSTAADLFGPTGRPAAATGAAATERVEAEDSGESGLRRLLKRMPGSRALAAALRSLVGRFANAPRELMWLSRSWTLVGQLDLLIVAGGGQLDEEWGGAWGHPYSLARWAVLAQIRRRAFVVASVGYCRLESARSRHFAAAALRRARYVSCRDPGSVAAVREVLGIAGAHGVPDLACAYPLDLASASPNGAERVAISPIAFGRPGSWPVAEAQVYGRYLRALARFAHDLNAAGTRLLVVTTSSPDWAAVADFQALLAEMGTPTGPPIEVCQPSSVKELLAALGTCSLVVASRLHGVILAHLLGKPVIPISFDRKVDAHLEDFGQLEWRTDLRSVTAEQLQLHYRRLVDRRSAVQAQLQALRLSRSTAVLQQFAQFSLISDRR